MLGASVALAATFASTIAGAQSYPTKPITVIIPFAGGSASDVVAASCSTRCRRTWGSRSSSRTAPAPAAIPAPARRPRRRRTATRWSAAARPGRGERHALQGARLRPREGPGDDLAVRGLHHHRGGQQEAAGPFAQGAGRPRQGQPRQAQLRLGRHRQLAASGRRIFLADQRREAHACALSQHRAVRARPDRRPGAARLPVVPERRRPIGAKGAIPLAVAGDKRMPRCRTRRPPPKPACRNTRNDGWFALLAPAGTPKPILEKLNKEMKAAVEDPQVKKGFETAGAETMSMPLGSGEEVAP